jgi:hypothetical protein
LKRFLNKNLNVNFDKSFGSRKDPKMHLKSEHKQKVKCKKCEETFERNCDLEEHIVASMK